MALGFKSRHGSHYKKNHAAFGLPSPCSLGSQKVRRSSDAEPSLSSLEEFRRDAGRKRVKGLLLVGHEKVSCRFGLRTGGCGRDTADGVGNHRRPAS